MSENDEPAFDHTVIGPIHEVVPRDRNARSLAEAIRHELDDCGAVRIVVDLTGHAGVADDQVDIIIDLIDPDDERWIVRLPDNVNDAIVDRLYEAGLDGHLIDDSDGDLPHHVDRPPHHEDSPD